MPAGRYEAVLWFLYPNTKAYELTGTATITISLCMNSFPKEKDIKLGVKIIKEGTKKQCSTQTKDRLIATLSDVNCVFIMITSEAYYFFIPVQISILHGDKIIFLKCRFNGEAEISSR